MVRTQFRHQLKDSALEYGRQGYAIFSLTPNEKIPQIGSKGYKDGSTSLEQIEEMWTESPSSNIGLVTGETSGLVVIDIDVKNNINGMHSFVELCGDYGIPDTRMVCTPSGGFHYYFLLPEGYKINCHVGVQPGIDVRGEGGYIVAPPSRLGNGDYQWEDDTVEIIVLPLWLQELLENIPSTRGSRDTFPLDTVLNGAPEGQRNDLLFRYTAQQLAKGLTRDEAYTLVQEAGRNCDPPFPSDELEKCFSQGWGYQPNYALTELGNSQRLISLYKHELKYVDGKHWIAWDRRKSVWNRDNLLALRMAQESIEFIGAEINNANEDRKGNLQGHYARSQTYRMFETMLNIARLQQVMQIEASDLDADPYKLKVVNGLLNLETGLLEEHDPSAYVTKGIDIVHDNSAVCPRFEKFLSEILQGDDYLIEYVQKAIGYTLTGSNQEQCMFLMFGDGSNGKSVLLSILSALLGEHMVAAPPQMLVKRLRSSSNDLARLQGSRLLTLSEESAASEWDEALVKQLTGGDTISARALYKEFEDFEVTAKMWMATNHLPHIRGTDHAIWRRIKVIPFNYTVPGMSVDRTLVKKLMEELPGILNWALQGCLRWLEEDLGTCPAVDNMTNQYRSNTDPMYQWLHEKTASIQGKKTKASVLYSSYEEYCSATGKQMNQTSFGREMKQRGYTTTRASEGNYYIGLELKTVRRRRRRARRQG